MNLKVLQKLQFFLVMVVLVIGIKASAQYKLTDKVPASPDVKMGKLPNGLTYYIQKNQKPEKRIELRLVVNAGSILEDNDQLGLAHFMEHMNFNGSKHFPKNELVNYLQTIGVKFGADLNAYTSFDETVYMLPIPSDKAEIVDKGFTVLEDWAGGATLSEEEINNERGVVLEELRRGKGAQERMRNQYFPKLFNNSRYAERLPIGKEDLLKTFKPEVIRKFYKDWYRPDLMAVIVVGDIDVAEAEAKIKEHFSALTNPANERVRPAITNVPERTIEEALSVSDKEGEQTQIQVINYIKPSKIQTVWGDYKDDLVKTLFSEMLNNRLEELTQKENPPFMYGFAGFDGFIRGYESFSATAVTGKGSVKDAIKAIVTETERVKKFGFTAAELERAKKSTLNGYEETVKEKGKIKSSAILEEFKRNFLEHELMPGSIAELAFATQTLPAITLEEVNALATKMDGGQKKFVLITGPEKRDVPVPANAELLAMVNGSDKSEIKAYEEKKIAAVLMDKAPAGGSIVKEEKDEDLTTTTLTLSNGVKVTLKPTNFKNDEILLKATRNGGTNLYGDNDAKSAEQAADIVTEMGIKDFSSTDLQKFLSGKTASVHPTIGANAEGFTGKSSVKDFETMLQMVYLYATAPRKDESLFKSYITKQKSMWTGMWQNPQVNFSDTMSKVLSQNNPRGGGVLKPTDFDKVNLDRLFTIYNERMGNMDGMNFFLVGNFDINTIKPLLISYLGTLPAKPAAHQYKDLGVRYPKGKIRFTYNKGSEKKSLIVINFGGETKYNPEESLGLQAASDVMEIRMIEKLREEMGGVYSTNIRASLEKIPYGKYSIGAYIPCGPENVNKLIDSTIQLVKTLKKDGPSEVNLNKVKEKWRKKYEEDIKTNNYWLSILSASFTNETDPKRVLTYIKRVDALTVQSVKEIANKYFNEDDYVVGILMPEEK